MSDAPASAERGRARPDREDRRTQAERSQATTEQLVAASRALFAEKGFAGTSIEDIVRAAGVTRGALYHHFASKEELFEAVFTREQQALDQLVRKAAAKKKGAWTQLKAGCDEFLTASLDPEIQRILMLDGPAVLGSRRAQEIDEANSIQLLAYVLQKAIDEGTLRKRPVMPLAQLLFGALCQAAMVVAKSDNPESTTRQMRREVQGLLDAMEGT